MHGWTDTVDPTQYHKSLSDVKLDIWVPPHTISHTFHSYTYIYHLWFYVLMLAHISIKQLPALSWVACYLYTLLTMFMCTYFHTHKYLGVLGYQNQDSHSEITSRIILNNIPSIVFPLIFYRYFFILLILITEFKIITAPKYISNNLIIKFFWCEI